MKHVLAALLGIAAFWGGLSYYQNHFMQPKPHAAVPSSEIASQSPDGQQTGLPDTSQYVKVNGPLANWMDRFNPWHKTPAPVPPPVPHSSDHVASSPVGTSSAIVHKTFAITSAAKFAFEVPPHAGC
jgi:hypothetical protein